MEYPQFDTAAERLDYVRTACLIPDDAALARAAGISPQGIANARRRDSIGKKLGDGLKASTGVSFGWLTGERVNPFPNGPIPYAGEVSGEAVHTLLNDIEAIRNAITALTRSLAQTTPRLTDVFLAELNLMPDRYKDGPLYFQLRKELQRVAAKPHAGHASKRTAARG